MIFCIVWLTCYSLVGALGVAGGKEPWFAWVVAISWHIASLKKLSDATLREHSHIMCGAWPFSHNVQNLTGRIEHYLHIDAVEILPVNKDSLVL